MSSDISKNGENPVDTNQDQNSSKSKKSWSDSIEGFWDRVRADMFSKKLFPIKCLFFFKFATLYVLYPFLTLHMKSLGLTPDETGINSAFIPIIAILGSPISGVIADKIGNFKVLMAMVTLSNAGMALLLLLVPVAREILPLPQEISFVFNCSSNSSFLLTSTDPSDLPCQLNRTEFLLPESVLKCGTICSSKIDSREVHLSEAIDRKMPDLVCDGIKNSCFLAFSEQFNSTGLDLDTLDLNTRIGIHSVRYLPSQLQSRSDSQSSVVKNVSQPSFLVDVKGQFLFSDRTFVNPPNCLNPRVDLGGTNKTSFCQPTCIVSYPRDTFCSNKEFEKVYDVGLTFGLYTIFRIILGLGSATSFIMFEGAVLSILKEYGGDYGLQKISGSLAGIVAAPFSGLLIHSIGDFRPSFYLYAVLQTFTAFLTLKINLEFKTPAKQVWGSLKCVLSQVEILLFFVAMLMSGSAWGYLESFLFWFIKDLGGTELLMGVTVSIGSIFGIPFLILSNPIIKFLGHVNVLCLGLVFFSFRLLGYSYITDPWYCLFFEALESVTNALALTAAATYALKLSTDQTITSIQGITGGLYFGFGRGLGSLLGGFLIKDVGHRNTFRIFALASLISGFLYYALNMAYIRKNSIQGINEATNLHVKDSSRRPNFKPDTNGNVKRKMANPPVAKITRTKSLEYQNQGYIDSCEDQIEEYTEIPLNDITEPKK